MRPNSYPRAVRPFAGDETMSRKNVGLWVYLGPEIENWIGNHVAKKGETVEDAASRLIAEVVKKKMAEKKKNS